MGEQTQSLFSITSITKLRFRVSTKKSVCHESELVSTRRLDDRCDRRVRRVQTMIDQMAPNGIKWFSAFEALRLAGDLGWLDSATRRRSQDWMNKNANRKTEDAKFDTPAAVGLSCRRIEKPLDF